MASSLRLALDTNVSVSAALFPNSPPGQVLDYALRQRVLLASAATLSELNAVLRRPRFDRYLLEDERLDFLSSLEQTAELVVITHRITACRDPKDDKFLELAVSGNASHIISGDRDLLALHPFRNISILTPAAFLAAQIGRV